jgi:hypothetical protein
MRDLRINRILSAAEERLVELYRTIAPAGNYETIDGERIFGNRFADKDEVVIRLRNEING